MCKCKVCKRKPSEISEYIGWGEIESMTPEEFVTTCESTYNAEDSSFVCTGCYIRIGQPNLSELRTMKFEK